jgi:hypothetical protein
MSPRDYLDLHYRQPVPGWLADFRPGSAFPTAEFFASRVVFYPGSGSDGHPVEVFGASHSAHCFVYADYGAREKDIRSELDSAHSGFRGYRSLARIALRPEDLAPPNWTRHLTLEEAAGVKQSRGITPAEVYGFAEILERHIELDDPHGPSRLAIVFLGADGHASYDALFCQPKGQSPFAVLVQDHGFAGNYSDWGAGGITSNIAERTGRLPRFLLVSKGDSRPWPGYSAVEGLEPSRGGVWNTERLLYSRESD